MNNYGYIYKTTNLINNKVYIGQKKGNFNPKYLGSGLLINKAIKKYGKNNFDIEIIDLAENKDKLNELEKKYITKYKKIFNKNSLYNITDGGEGGSGIITHTLLCKCSFCKAKRGERKGINHPIFGKRYIRSEKTKRLLSEVNRGIKNHNYGHPRSKEYKLKMKIAMIGNKNGIGNRGKIRSEEYKRKLSKFFQGKSLIERNHKLNCKCIGCLAKQGKLKGKNHPRFDKKHKESTKQLMKEVWIKRKSQLSKNSFIEPQKVINTLLNFN